MGDDLVLFGNGSIAQLAHFYFSRDSDHRVVAFTVHEAFLKSRELLGLPVVPFETIERHYPPARVQMFVAIGYRRVNRARAEVCAESKRKGYQLASYVSSRCTCWSEEIGDNGFILEDNTIQPFVKIGDNVTLWSGNHIGHHAVIEDHCFVSSHVVISGHVHIGPYTFLGVNASIRDGVRVGASCVIGAGALIMKQTRDKEVYLGPRSHADPRSSDQIDF